MNNAELCEMRSKASLDLDFRPCHENYCYVSIFVFRREDMTYTYICEVYTELVQVHKCFMEGLPQEVRVGIPVAIGSQ